jgi:thiol-disulfide isomerase/thioredoxin
MIKRLHAGLLSIAIAFPALAAAPVPLGDEGWRELLRNHAGQAMIVHFWGVTCAPCLAELPRWGELRQSRPDLALVLVEADPMPVEARRAEAFLNRAGLEGVESRAIGGLDERQRFQIDPDWAGELPMTLLVGLDGEIEKISGAADFDLVRRWVDREGSTRP